MTVAIVPARGGSKHIRAHDIDTEEDRALAETVYRAAGPCDAPMPLTEQAEFWRGSFGDRYTERNTADHKRIEALVDLWVDIADCFPTRPARIVEVGANLGNNLWALGIIEDAELFAVEPNASARQHLIDDRLLSRANVMDGLACSIPLTDNSVDLAFTSGVLIHVHPDDLLASCAEIHRVSRKFIVCIEYFSDQPEEKPYRGHRGKLFKRDFGAFWLDHFDLKPLGCGFAWKRLTGLDNLTWWAFEKC